MDCRDVGVIERRNRLSFTMKSSDPLLIIAELFGQNFDGDLSIQLTVAGESQWTRNRNLGK
jgi:hypothetical protein